MTAETKSRLKTRVAELYDLMDPCRLCPRHCLARRRHGKLGECGIGDRLVVSSIMLHRGNEFPISGCNGSGNIFLSGCSLHCVYCQNWTISQKREGKTYSVSELADAMLDLQASGAHNINWVTPTHVVPLLFDALAQARENGLKLPLVYNSSGYDSLEVLRLIDSFVDIYLPDMKYGDAETARRFSDIEDYPEHNRNAVREMYRQVGPLQYDTQGIARRGLLVRHLVLPEDAGNYGRIFNFLETELPGPVDVNVMAQYRPCYKAGDFPELRQGLKPADFESALNKARSKSSLRIIS